MQIPNVVWLVGAVALLIIIVLLFLFYKQAQQVNLTRPKSPDEKPEWLKMTPPAETMAATLAEGEGITLYNYDEGERLAAPFAEQVEDILIASIKDDPELGSLKIDLGTAVDGGLEIWVEETCYLDIADLPYPRLQEALRQAVNKWNTSQA